MGGREAGGVTRPARLVVAAGVAMLAAAPTVADCAGAIRGFWEKRPEGSSGPFEPFETFRIDPASGVLSLCARDRRWESDFEDRGDSLVFTYARRERVLRRGPDGAFASDPWVAEHEGVRSEYRVRALR